MGAYSKNRTLKEETREVCDEMKNVILAMIDRGDISREQFEEDPYSYMDPVITYGDGWYEKIIISRVKKELKKRFDDHEINLAMLEQLENEYYENRQEDHTAIQLETIPF